MPHSARVPRPELAAIAPLTNVLHCPQVGCAIVFPEFVDICTEHITASGLAIEDFLSFEQECLDLDGLALVDYVLSLKARGCAVDVDGWASAGSGRHRRSLAEFFASAYVRGTPGCEWDQLDDLIHHVGEICCAGDTCDAAGNPASCRPGCAIATHKLMDQCGATMERVLGHDTMQAFSTFEEQCFDDADPSVFMQAIEHAHCPEDDPLFSIFVGSANGDSAVVASIANNNHVSLNGEPQGILQKGELWQGIVNRGDAFTASGPIYGIVQRGHGGGDRVMSPGFLQGTEFAVANSRRATAHLYMNCVDAPCHVTVSTGADVVDTQDIEPGGSAEIVVEGASGSDRAIIVSSTGPIVLAVGDGATTDYMPVAPVASEVFGVASTHLSIAAAGSEPMTVTETCDDTSTQDLQLPAAGAQLDRGGYSSQYTGKACKYQSSTMDGRGHPRQFAAHGYGDGDGGASTAFLPSDKMSTDFVAPIDFEFLVFVAAQPGTLTVDGIPRELDGADGVYKARVEAGSAGTQIESSVPVWATLESAATQEEQLLYGHNAGRNEDRRVYRIYVAQADSSVATVASIVDGNEILQNGESLGVFSAGDLWQGQVHGGDSFTASGPIYGISRSGSNAYVMAPGRLRGREFAVPNSRRSVAKLSIVCLENPCHVTVSTSDGVTNTEDMPPDSYLEVSVNGAVGGEEAISVSSSEPIVLAVGDASGDTDFMPVPPVAAEVPAPQQHHPFCLNAIELTN